MGDPPNAIVLSGGRINPYSEKARARQLPEHQSSHNHFELLGDHGGNSELDFLPSYERLLQDKQKLFLLHQRESRSFSVSQQILAAAPSSEMISTHSLEDQTAEDHEGDCEFYWNALNAARAGGAALQGLSRLDMEVASDILDLELARPRKLKSGHWMWSDRMEIRAAGTSTWIMVDVHIDSRKVMFLTITLPKEVMGIICINDAKAKTPWKIWVSEANRRIDLRVKEREYLSPRVMVIELRSSTHQKREEFLRIFNDFRRINAL
ncbi:uncharacterized protein LOC129584897 [Paramacrobiotus metropolitanus]|uniref:uncharacterized protein LOC129584897 n=1 Tax=Paramacrobiotus metropolitanus TaxID=2943436 RepID=UPI002445CBAA|nr:uncharacterized protein LOC129584897 [Paramacrobiotus metropolitanus]